MAMIAYDRGDADAFAATRHVPASGLSHWRAAVGAHLSPGMRVLDLGAGTGSWARSFTSWFPGISVVGVEPSEAMRTAAVFSPILAGDASSIPLGDATVDAVWLSTVIHHVPSLPAAAREIRRVLRPGGPVLIRSAFAGRGDGITIFRYFTAALRILDTYPSADDVTAAFSTAGFSLVSLTPVPQETAPSLREAVSALRREAHTPLQLITDDEYATGLAAIRAAADTTPGPVVDELDFLVLR